MTLERAASVIFICFSMLVAFSNVYIGEYQYIIFIIPFIVSLSMKDKIRTFCESLGLVIISSYLIFCQDSNVGIMGMLVSTLIVLGIHKTNTHLYIQIVISAAIIFTASVLNYSGPEQITVRAFKNSCIYVVCIFAVYFKFKQYSDRIKLKSIPIDQKYLEVIDQLVEVAHESIDALKKMQDGCHGRKR